MGGEGRDEIPASEFFRTADAREAGELASGAPQIVSVRVDRGNRTVPVLNQGRLLGKQAVYRRVTPVGCRYSRIGSKIMSRVYIVLVRRHQR